MNLNDIGCVNGAKVTIPSLSSFSQDQILVEGDGSILSNGEGLDCIIELQV